MDAVLNVLQDYSKIIAWGAGGLAVLITLFLLARILTHMKRLNKNLSGITENVQAYFDVILSEDAEEGEIQEIQQAVPEQHSWSGEERRIKSAEQQKKEEEEKIVNAVLQEYFT